MAPNMKVVRAFKAMRDLGIAEEKVKPVLKNLLKLYEKNWALIEEENYRALADAIFDTEESEALEQKKSLENTQALEQQNTLGTSQRDEYLEEETQAQEEPERPLKRLRLRHQEVQASPSLPTASLGALPIKPKVEEDESSEAHPQLPLHDITTKSQSALENTSSASQPVSPQPLIRNKGKQPGSPNALTIRERFDTSLVGAAAKNQPVGSKRKEPDSVILPRLQTDKGKGPLIPQVSPVEKRSNSNPPAHSVRISEPSNESCFVNVPRQQIQALIKPKEEPVTDEVPRFELPIAVIRPESAAKDSSSNANDSARELDVPKSLPGPSVVEKNKADGFSSSSREKKDNSGLAIISNQSTSNLEIASSPLGEVKMSLICDSTVRVPGVDELLEKMEDKCSRAYKDLDPNFSVKKFMKDLSDKGAPSSVLNGSAEAETLDQLPIPEVPRLPPPCNGVDNNVQELDEDIDGTECNNDKGTVQNGYEERDSQNLEVVKSLHNINVIDIARGQERVIISLVNEVNSEPPPKFHYIPQNVVFQNAYLNFSLARIGDDHACSDCTGNCLSLSSPCACSYQTGGEFAYTSEGLVKVEVLEESISMNRDPQKHCLYYCKECPLERSKNEETLNCKGHLVRNFIKECWWKCGCDKQCGNRVVQRGISRNLQVFMTPEGKGWGLRTLEDLPKGAFVCEYVGEVLTNAELFDRVSYSFNKDEHAYPVLLDADWGAESKLKDEEALCLDATYYGNVARFINHRCFDSTLVEIPVEVETPDHHYYHLAFFTTRKVKALEELTWDYGIDFDDHEHPVKAFSCRCGSKFCRNMKRSSRRAGSRRRR